MFGKMMFDPSLIFKVVKIVERGKIEFWITVGKF